MTLTECLPDDFSLLVLKEETLKFIEATDIKREGDVGFEV